LIVGNISNTPEGASSLVSRNQYVNFGGFAVIVRATLFRAEDLIAFDAVERERRQMPISTDAERTARPANRILIQLEAEAGGA